MANWNTLVSFACSPNIPCGLRHNVKRRANRKQHVHLFQTKYKSLLRRKMCEPWMKKSRNCGKAPILQFRWLALQLDYLFLTYSAIKPKLAEITWLKVSGIKKKHTHTHAKVIVLLLNSYDVVPLSEIRNLMLCWLMNVEWILKIFSSLFWSGLHLFRIVYFHRRRGPSFRCLTEHVRYVKHPITWRHYGRKLFFFNFVI